MKDNLEQIALIIGATATVGTILLSIISLIKTRERFYQDFIKKKEENNKIKKR